jgi:hypothetical protein
MVLPFMLPFERRSPRAGAACGQRRRRSLGPTGGCSRGSQLHIPQAEAEDMIEPRRMADDLGWEAIAGVGGGL